ncbi:MAG: hypothetical protein ACRDYW_12305 [Acidimicrobiales bacterium]
MEAVVASSGGDPEHPRTRRQLLTLAGGAVAGGTALVLGAASPASAASGGPLLMGVTNNDPEGDITGLNGASFSGAAFQVIGLGASGVNAGISAAATGTAADSVDVKLNGTGRLSQVAGASGDAQPANQIDEDLDNPIHELVRSETGVLWASTGTGSAASTAWKRINAVRLDNPNGNGSAFTPFRLLDTRSGAARNSNQTYDLDVSGSANLPDDVVGVFGNITAVVPTFGGFLKLFPRTTGSPPNTSAVNFNAGDVVANSFFVGVGRNAGWTGGQVSIRGGDAGGTYHVLVDITAYVQ